MTVELSVDFREIATRINVSYFNSSIAFARRPNPATNVFRHPQQISRPLFGSVFVKGQFVKGQFVKGEFVKDEEQYRVWYL